MDRSRKLMSRVAALELLVPNVIDGEFFNSLVLLTGQTDARMNGVYRVGPRGGLSRVKPPPDVAVEYIGRKL